MNGVLGWLAHGMTEKGIPEEHPGPEKEDFAADGPILLKAAGDALHIAVATVYRCEYLLTWNCPHIANAEIQRTARLVAKRHGFELPVICTPEELMGGEE